MQRLSGRIPPRRCSSEWFREDLSRIQVLIWNRMGWSFECRSFVKWQWLAFKLCLLGCSFVAAHHEDQSKSYLGMLSSHPLPRSATMRPGPSVRFALRLRLCGLLEDSHNQRNRESRERYPLHLKNMDGWKTRLVSFWGNLRPIFRGVCCFFQGGQSLTAQWRGEWWTMRNHKQDMWE